MGKLILVGTSLGNIEDLSIRAIKNLFTCEIILAEDTRVFKKLQMILKERYLNLLEQILDSPLNNFTTQQILSYREQNHDKMTPQIIEKLKEGKDICLTTDAGMPTISDPGFRLVQEILKEGLEIDVIPGPTAIETALSISGLPTDKFVFLGFLPRKRGKILELLNKYIELEQSIILYESPYRVVKLLEILKDVYGENLQVAACKDLTKKFQEVHRGSVTEVLGTLGKNVLKGEWVVVVGNREQLNDSAMSRGL